MKKIFLAGATGSIGSNVLYCMRELNEYYNNHRQRNQRLQLVGIVVRKNITTLTKWFKRLKATDPGFTLPDTMVSTDEKVANQLKLLFPKAKIYTSIENAIRNTSFDILINALSGSIGLRATLPAVEKKSIRILLANKESLVMAGRAINTLLKKNCNELIPIDSEHSAIFQLVASFKSESVARVILTASGGPFFRKFIKSPTVAQALKHPNWNMGRKISIDSATMMNKGLEVIEAHHLFNFPYDRIGVVIHPQSIAHSFIETHDGTQYAQLGSTDMRHPIFLAMTHPKILPNHLKKFHLSHHPTLEFFEPNIKQFPMLKLAYDCGELEIKQGGNHCTVMNAANEEAVELFLQEKISFKEIYELTRHMVRRYHISRPKQLSNIRELIALDEEIKIKTKEVAKRKFKS